MGDVVDVRSGKDYKHLSEGNIPVYGTGGFMLSVNQALSYDEDAIGIGRKGTIDKPYILKAPFWTVDTLFYAIPREKVDLNFAFDVFQNIDWKKKDESTGVPSLSKTAINEIDVLVPQYDEQQPLGQFFNRIDNLITLGDKIECLNKIYYPAVYERYAALSDFLGCSKKALAIRMKQLGLLHKDYLDNPFDYLAVYPEVYKI